MPRTAVMRDGEAESEQRVTPLELFFDLVFVFAITFSASSGGPGRRTRGSPTR